MFVDLDPDLQTAASPAEQRVPAFAHHQGQSSHNHSAPEDATGPVRAGGCWRGSLPGPKAEEDPGREPAGAAETQLRGGPQGPAGGPGVQWVSTSTDPKSAYLLGGIISFMLLCPNSLVASLLLAYFFSMRLLLLLLSLCVLCRDGRELLRIKETVDNCIQMVTRDIQVSPTKKLANLLTGGDQWAIEFDRDIEICMRDM